MSLAACFPVLVAGLSVNVPQLLLMGLILAVATGAASIVTRWARPRVPRVARARGLAVARHAAGRVVIRTVVAPVAAATAWAPADAIPPG